MGDFHSINTSRQTIYAFLSSDLLCCTDISISGLEVQLFTKSYIPELEKILNNFDVYLIELRHILLGADTNEH
jgi:hypothetical protein